ncbi:ABC transporter ATP-binding protein, partial [Paracoccus sp. (in: a-proteobacteria)]|uniref:ABC transporter ATP-binding protein n=1 Tax=Paracoccus sp. TaxID=267 RepID=UPI0028B0FCC9
PGKTLGIVGESGSGKSTLGRMLLGLETPHAGEVLFRGQPMPKTGTPEWRRMRAQMQLIFQDPLAALDRRMTIAAQIAEPLQIHEPVSALDVSIQAQVVNLLRDLQERNGLTMVFISHDLKVVRNICDRVAVMYLGRVVEEAPSDVIFSDPCHPYTQALVSSVPRPGQGLEGRILLQGEPPNPAARPSGCAFHPRCRLADAHCAGPVPQLRDHQGRLAACLKLSDRLQPAA